jgi:hypothetical protein
VATGEASGTVLGTVGIIASVSEPFCSDCRRTRVTAEGKIMRIRPMLVFRRRLCSGRRRRGTPRCSRRHHPGRTHRSHADRRPWDSGSGWHRSFAGRSHHPEHVPTERGRTAGPRCGA